jgi:hypothetical protein
MVTNRIPLKLKLAKLFTGLLFLFLTGNIHAQVLSLSELIEFPFIGPEKTEEKLKAKGWENSNIEFVADSDLVRKTWSVDNKYNDLKSYVQFWEFNRQVEDNHISYQFSDRKTFEKYLVELKKSGYKESLPKSKKRKKKKGDPNIYKEIDVPYINEKTNSLIVLREVFLYGMNAFMLYSYKAESKTAQYLINQEKDK